MACFSHFFRHFIKRVIPSAWFLAPKRSALFIAFAVHAPLVLVPLSWPQVTVLPPLKVVTVGLALQEALEVALTQKNSSWELQLFGLPTLLSASSPPPVLYSSYVLVDSAEGKIVWAKPHPLLDHYLAELRFAPVEGSPKLLSGYIATEAKP